MKEPKKKAHHKILLHVYTYGAYHEDVVAMVIEQILSECGSVYRDDTYFPVANWEIFAQPAKNN